MADSSRDVELRIRASNLTKPGLQDAVANLNTLVKALEAQAKSAREAMAAHQAAMTAGAAAGKGAEAVLKSHERALAGLEKQLKAGKTQLDNFSAALVAATTTERAAAEAFTKAAAVRAAASQKAFFDQSLAGVRAQTAEQVRVQKAAADDLKARQADATKRLEDFNAKNRQVEIDGALTAFNVRREANRKALGESVRLNDLSKTLSRERHEDETKQARRTVDEIRKAEREKNSIRQEGSRLRPSAELLGSQSRTDAMGRPGRGASANPTAFLGLRPYELTNLGYQVNDVISGLASGQNMTQILAQQGGQFIQIFGTAALKWFPLVAAAAGVVAVAVGGLTRSLRDAAATREFGALLDVNTQSARYNVESLKELTKSLRDVGVSWDDAVKTIKMATAANVLPESLTKMVMLARDVARVHKKDVPEAMQELISGFGGGEKALQDLMGKYPALSDASKKLVADFLKEGEVGKAKNVVLREMGVVYKDAAEKYIGPLTRASENLSAAWDDLLITIGKSKAFSDLVTSLTSFVEGLKSATEWVDSLARKLDDPKVQFAFKAAGLAMNVASYPARTIGNAIAPSVSTAARWGGAVVGAAQSAFEGQQPIATASIPATGRADIVAEATSLEGLNEKRDREKLREYMRAGGSDLDPATVAWCAAFANAVLARKGLQGTGSNIATSFLSAGTAVTGAPQAGDVVVLPRGAREGQTGGHVGFATGQTREGQIEIVSGNKNDSVSKSWENISEAIVRRIDAPTKAAGAPVSVSPNGPIGQTDAQKTALANSVRDTREQLELAKAISREDELRIISEQARRRIVEATGDAAIGSEAEANQQAAIGNEIELKRYERQKQAFNEQQEDAKKLVTDGVNADAIALAGERAKAVARKAGIEDFQALREVEKKGQDEQRALIERQNQEQDKLDSQKKSTADLERGLLNQHKSAIDQLNQATNLQYDERIKQLDKLGERQSTIDKSEIEAQKQKLEGLRAIALAQNIPKAAEAQAREALGARSDIISAYTKLEAAGEITITEKENRIKEAFDATRQSILGAATALETFLNSNRGNLTETEILKITARIKELRAETKYVDPFWKELKDTFSNSFVSGIDTAFNTIAEAIGGAIAKTKEWKEVFVSIRVAALKFFADLLKDLATFILKAEGKKLFSSLLGLVDGDNDSGGGGFGIGGLLGKLFGFGGSSSTSAAGIGFDYGGGGDLGMGASVFGAGIFKRGGVAGRTVVPTQESWWANAPRYRSGAIVGLSPDEQRAILHRGEEVLSSDNPRNILNGGGRTGDVHIRNVLVDDRRRIAEAMQGVHGERVIVQTLVKHGATVRELVRG